jgi:hypothetical protein
MKGIRGCLLVILGFLGIFFSVILSFTFYLLPLAFLIFLGSLILISYAIGSAEEQIIRGPGPGKKNDT